MVVLDGRDRIGKWLGWVCEREMVKWWDEGMCDVPVIGVRRMGGADATTAVCELAHLQRVSSAYVSTAFLMLFAAFDCVLGVFLVLAGGVWMAGWDTEVVPMSVYVGLSLGVITWLMELVVMVLFLVVVHWAIALAWWRGGGYEKPERFKIDGAWVDGE
jgi:hypothetical protein